MEEEFDLSEVVSDATKAKADRDFYLAMATQSKATSPIAAYLAGAAGAKAASLAGKLQAQKDAQAAAEKFTKRRDNLVLNMHSIARDTTINPATKAGMIGLIAREIGLQPKNYDAENNVLNVADPQGNMMTFDFKEKLDEKGKKAIEKINAEIEVAGARKKYYEALENKARSGGSGKQDYLKLPSLTRQPDLKSFFEKRRSKQTTEEAVSRMSPQAQKTLLKGLWRLSPSDQELYSDDIKYLEEKFNMKPWQYDKEPQSTMTELSAISDEELRNRLLQ